MKKRFHLILASFVVAIFTGCLSGPLRKPEVKEKINMEGRKPMVVLVDQLSSNMPDELAASTAMKGLILKKVGTIQVIPTLPGELSSLPREYAIAGIAGNGNAITLKAALMNKVIALARKVGTFDTVVLISIESRSPTILERILSYIPISPAARPYSMYGAVYDVKTEKVIGAAVKHGRLVNKAYAAQLPYTGSGFAGYLLNGDN